MKEKFVVRDDKKVTEKMLGRVLSSSIATVLLCMTCLAGTTWALFAVSIENKDNVIQIGKPEATVTVNGVDAELGSVLEAGTYTMKIDHGSVADDLKQKSTLYVTVTIDGTTSNYVVLGGNGLDTTEINLDIRKTCHLAWDATWFEPANAGALLENKITIDVEVPTEATQTVMEPTEELSEPSEEIMDPTKDTIPETVNPQPAE